MNSTPRSLFLIADHGSISMLFCAVGNIPYEVTESQLIDIFSDVGPIKHMR